MHTPLPRSLALAAASLLLLAGCGDEPAPAAGDSPTRASDDGDRPSQSPPAEPEATDSGSGSTVAAYLIGDTERAGPRLYREFQRHPGEPLQAAATALTAPPADPDYRTAWTDQTLLGLSFEGSGTDGQVDVAVDPSVRERPAGMSRAEAEAAVQQVVYTAQAAVQERVPVGFSAGGGPIDQVFGVPTSEPLAEGPALGVLSHASLTTPAEGAVVGDGSLEVAGVGSSFEATMGWEVLQGDRVVDRGFVTMEGWMEPRLFPFETTVDVSGLEPGEYTVRVSTDDPTGGTEGIGSMSDDRAFVVE